MKIAIISDIHDNIWNLHAAMQWLTARTDDEAIDSVICCGDLCSPFVMGILVSYCRQHSLPIHLVFGNNDGDAARITSQAKGYPPLSVHYEFGELVEWEGKLIDRTEFEKVNQVGSFLGNKVVGKRIAIQHYDTIALSIAAAEQYDLVCFGHNHQVELRRYTRTVAVNPGTLLGYKPREAADCDPTFAIYDSAAASGDEVEFFRVKSPWSSAKKPGKVQPVKVKETKIKKSQVKKAK